ncbi:glycoside hydrolase family 32 protein [Rubripirellula amarantea]|nr:glycoside hydrolase family 32 protein [Rubripirellula amarantea]
MNTHPVMFVLLLLTLLPSPLFSAGVSGEDLVIADFETDSYGNWTVTGNAFGTGPAKGTLPGQMKVSGFKGKGLVNSFLGGDKSKGTLTSAEFKLSQPYITFLIGGGGFPGKTAMRLLHDGKVVREATGTNVEPGGSEALSQGFWDVSDLQGQTLVIEIIDDAVGGWGHINVDQIVQSDHRPSRVPMQKSIVVDQPYLIIPIQNGGEKVTLEVSVNGKPVRHYTTELAMAPESVDWYAYFSMDAYAGQEAVVRAERVRPDVFDLVAMSAEVPGSQQFYKEPLRPQFHFSQKVGWNNDPNGMVFLDGEWHLYFQHNPVGWNWGNMTWGHAVSKDLVHWEQLPNVLFPETMATGACFSGGATVDFKNTAGWKEGDEDVLVAFLTDTGAGEAVVYSRDRGRTFSWYEGNPIIQHKGRDPKVIWYAYDDTDRPLDETAEQLGGHWAMVVYDETEGQGQRTSFYTSTNLKDWSPQSHLSGYYECPELFELAVDGDANNTRWVTFAADGKYVLGDFDGKSFTPEKDSKLQLFHGNIYASQTFDNAPDDRRILIGWSRIDMPGMPFNQAFTFPHELTLRTTPEGIRLFSKPVKEIESIYTGKQTAVAKSLTPKQSFSLQLDGELYDVEATFEIGNSQQVGLRMGNNEIVFNAQDETVMGVPANMVDKTLTLRVLVDRSQLEVWVNDGATTITERNKTVGPFSLLEAFAIGGEATLSSLQVHQLESAWPKE